MSKSSILIRLGAGRGWNFKVFSSTKLYSVSVAHCLFIYYFIRAKYIKKKFKLVCYFIVFLLKRCIVHLFFWRLQNFKKKNLITRAWKLRIFLTGNRVGNISFLSNFASKTNFIFSWFKVFVRRSFFGFKRFGLRRFRRFLTKTKKELVRASALTGLRTGFIKKEGKLVKISPVRLKAFKMVPFKLRGVVQVGFPFKKKKIKKIIKNRRLRFKLAIAAKQRKLRSKVSKYKYRTRSSRFAIKNKRLVRLTTKNDNIFSFNSKTTVFNSFFSKSNKKLAQAVYTPLGNNSSSVLRKSLFSQTLANISSNVNNLQVGKLGGVFNKEITSDFQAVDAMLKANGVSGKKKTAYLLKNTPIFFSFLNRFLKTAKEKAICDAIKAKVIGTRLVACLPRLKRKLKSRINRRLFSSNSTQGKFTNRRKLALKKYTILLSRKLAKLKSKSLKSKSSKGLTRAYRRSTKKGLLIGRLKALSLVDATATPLTKALKKNSLILNSFLQSSDNLDKKTELSAAVGFAKVSSLLKQVKNCQLKSSAAESKSSKPLVFSSFRHNVSKYSVTAKRILAKKLLNSFLTKRTFSLKSIAYSKFKRFRRKEVIRKKLRIKASLRKQYFVAVRTTRGGKWFGKDKLKSWNYHRQFARQPRVFLMLRVLTYRVFN